MITLPNPTPEVKKLSKFIGAEAALSLIEQRGGNRIYIPTIQRVHRSELEKVVGLTAAQALAVPYGPGWHFIPLAREWRIPIYRMRGMTYAEIARAVGCTESQVGRILRAQEMTGKQLDLGI